MASTRRDQWPGSRIAAVRRFVGETQEQFGARFGVGRRPVLEWERDAYKPSEEVYAELTRLAEEAKSQCTGELIADVRRYCSETQDEFGARFGVTRRTVRDWETEVYPPSEEFRFRLLELAREMQQHALMADRPTKPVPVPKVGDFGPHLRKLREERRLSVADLAVASGIPRETVYRIEASGTDHPNLLTLRKLAAALAVDMNTLCNS